MQIEQISIPKFRSLAESKESNKIGANYAEFTRLYLTWHELHEFHVVHAPSRFTVRLRKNSLSCADCMELESFTDPVGKWHEICSICEQFVAFVVSYKRLT